MVLGAAASGAAKIGLAAVFDLTNWEANKQRYIQGVQMANQATGAAASGGGGMGAMNSVLGMLGGTLNVAKGAAIGAGIAIVGLGLAAAGALSNLLSLDNEAMQLAGRFRETESVAQLLGQRQGMTAEEVTALSDAIRAQGIRTDVANGLIIQFSRYSLDMAQSSDLAAVAQNAAVISMSDSSETLDRLLHGIQTYNSRVLRTAGLNVDVDLSFQRYAATLGKTKDELNETEKQQAVLNAVLAEGAKIQGVYATAMNEPIKQLRSLQGREIPELQAALAGPFLNAWGGVISTIRDFVKWLTEAAREGGFLYPILVNLGAVVSLMIDGFRAAGGAVRTLVEAIISALGGIVQPISNVMNNALNWGVNIITNLAVGIVQGAAQALTWAMGVVTRLLTGFLAPGSPPKILPKLPQWGAAAMTEYLKGFGDADFKALAAIQGPLGKAFDILTSTGKMGEGAGGKLMAKISADFAKALNTGQLNAGTLDTITKKGGMFGKELADLAKKQFDLAMATKQVEEAEQDLTDARTRSSNANQTLNKEIALYNKMLRSGASKQALADQLKKINLAKEEQKVADQTVLDAEEKVEQTKEGITALEEQAKLQEQLINQLLQLTQQQIVIPAPVIAEPAAAGGAGGGGLSGIGEQLGESLGEGFQNAVATAVENAKQMIRDKLADLFAPLKERWDQDVAPALELVKQRWDEMTAAIKLFYDEKIAPVVEDVVEWFQTKIPEALAESKRWWNEELMPAVQAVNDYIDQTFGETLRLLVELFEVTLAKAIEIAVYWYEEKLKPALEDIWDFIDRNFMPSIEGILKVFSDTWIFIRDELIPIFANGLKNALNEFWQHTLERVAEKLKIVSDIFRGIRDFVKWLIDNINKIQVPDVPGSSGAGSVGFGAFPGVPGFATGFGAPAFAPSTQPVTTTQSAITLNFYNNISSNIDIGVLEAVVVRTVRRALNG